MLLSVGTIENKSGMLRSFERFKEMGIKLFATEGTHKFLAERGIEAELADWPLESDAPESAVQRLRNGEIDLVINIPSADKEDELTNGYRIRRAAIDFNVPLITNRQIGERLSESMWAVRKSGVELEIKSWREYTSAV